MCLIRPIKSKLKSRFGFLNVNKGKRLKIQCHDWPLFSLIRQDLVEKDFQKGSCDQDLKSSWFPEKVASRRADIRVSNPLLSVYELQCKEGKFKWQI